MNKFNQNFGQNFGQFASYDQYGAEWAKQLEQSVSACREASDAWMQSGSVFAKGFESLFSTCVSRAQNANEKTATNWQSLFACRTVNEFAETQNKLAQDTFEDVIEATTQVSELSAKVMMDVFEPLNKQMSEAMKYTTQRKAA